MATVRAAAVGLVVCAHGDMYDVLLPQHLGPAECNHGCADLGSLPPRLDGSALWHRRPMPPTTARSRRPRWTSRSPCQHSTCSLRSELRLEVLQEVVVTRR